MVEGDIFHILQPSLFLKKRFGFLSADFKRATRPIGFEKSKLHFAIWTVVQICVLIMLTRLYWISIQYYSGLKSILEWMNYVAYYLLDIVLFAISILSSKINNEKMIEVLNRFAIIESNLKLLGLELDRGLKKKCVWIVTIFIVVDGFHIVTLTYSDYNSAGNIFMSLYRSLLTLYIDIAHVGQAVYFVCVTLIVRDMIRQVETYFKRHVYVRTHESGKYSEEVWTNNVAIMYQDIFENFAEFARIISIPMLFDFALVFSVITFHTFNLSALVLGNKLDTKYVTTMSFSFCVLMYATTCVAAYIIASEKYHDEVLALKKTLLKTTAQTKDDVLRREINALSLQISHENYEVTAAGFFVIDIKLVFSIIAAIGMYAIVLMQFDPNAGVFEQYIKHHVL